MLTKTLLSSATESTPSTITTSCRSTSRAPSSPTVHPSLWAPETDYTCESSILRAYPSVHSVAFPRVPISPSTRRSCDPRPLHTVQFSEPSRLNTIEEGQSGELPPITYSSPSSRTLTPIVSDLCVRSTVLVTYGDCIDYSLRVTHPVTITNVPTAPSPSLRAPPSTASSTPVLTAERSQVRLMPSSVRLLLSLWAQRSSTTGLFLRNLFWRMFQQNHPSCRRTRRPP